MATFESPAFGEWWVPPHQSHVAPGILELGDRIELTTYDALVPAEGEAQFFADRAVVEPVVHGRLYQSGSLVTLFDVAGWTHGVPRTMALAVVEDYAAQVAIVGKHLDAESPFDRLFISVSDLDKWANAPALYDSMTYNENRWDSATLRLGRVSLEKCELDNATLELEALVEGSTGSERVEVKRVVQFRVELHQPCQWREVLHDWVSPLRDLMSFLLVQRVIPENIYAHVVGEGPREDFAKFETRWMRHAGAPPPERQRGLVDQDTLFRRTGAPCSFEELVKAWFALPESLSAAVRALVAAQDAPFLFAEHRYLIQLIAAERAHGAVGSPRELSQEEHATRVSSVVDAAILQGAEPSTIEWAEAVLRSRNDKSLRTRIAELLDMADEVGGAIRTADPEFARHVAEFRTPVAHAASSDPDAVEKRWRTGEALAWLARTIILQHIGLTAAQAAKCVQQNREFQFGIGRLGELR